MHQLSYRKNPQPGRKACFMGSLFQDSTTTTPTTWSHNSCLNRPVFRVTGKKLYQSDIIHMTFIFSFQKVDSIKVISFISYHIHFVIYSTSFQKVFFRFTSLVAHVFSQSSRAKPSVFRGPRFMCFVVVIAPNQVAQVVHRHKLHWLVVYLPL